MRRTPVALPFSGAKLRALRQRQGLRQVDLSDKTAADGRRVQRAHISRYENGETVPTVTTFRALVQALGCEPDDLLDSQEVAVA
jgi:transcriptional regulator with XRE-family HTH domain